MIKANESKLNSFFRNFSAYKTILALNIIVFMLQNIFGNVFDEMFMLISADIFQRPWILVTSMFLHGGLGHLFLNMWALLIFGSLIERLIGSKRFLIIYLISGILSSFLSSFLYPRALGASGAIMGIIGLVIVLLPDLKVLLFFVIPMSMRTAGIIFILYETFGMFFSTSNIGHLAHLVGLVIGLAYGFYLKNKKKQVTKRIFFQNQDPSYSVVKRNTSKELSDEDIDNYVKYGRL